MNASSAISTPGVFAPTSFQGCEGLGTDSFPLEPSDDALMQRIAARDSLALDQLHARHQTLLHKIVASILPNQADAEETIQDVFVEIWTRAENFDACKGKPLGWMVCMARRRAIDHLRKICSRAESTERLRLQEEQATSAVYKDEVTTADLRCYLHRAIGELPAEQEQVVHLAYYQAMSQREIARHVGVAHGTIKTRLELARSKLLRQLAPLREELSCAR